MTLTSLGINHFGLFCLAVLLLNATPGPDTAYIVGRSVAQGRRSGVISALGISLGCCGHALASAFGLTAILAASSDAFTVIKLTGGAYLVYMGGRMLLSKANHQTAAAIDTSRSGPTIFWQATLTNLLNPKVILFFLSFFPQFVLATTPNKTFAFLFLGAVFAAMSLVWNCGTALVSGYLVRRARGNPRVRQWLERVVGVAFVGLGIRLATTTT